MTDNSDEITVNLQRAETSIRAAKDMIEKGYYDIAASRAYYAAFYTASALLLKQSSKSDCQSDLQEALSLSRRAVEIFTRLRHPDLQSAQERLAEIEKAGG